jgi:hypothetical protein
MGNLEVPNMNVSSAPKAVARRILSGVAGLILIAAPLMVTAAAADPYDTPGDVAAYQAYGQAQYGQPMPPSGQYPAPSYAQRNQLEAQLNYAEAQYNRAQQAGDWGAAKHWKKQIKHLRRELSGGGHQEGPGYGSGYGAPSSMPPMGPSYSPPGSAYEPPMQGYPPPGQGQAYGQPYPPAGYPPTGYPNSGSAYQYGATGAPGQAGSTGGLSSLLGPLFGGGGAPAGAPGYPQAGYQNPAAGSPYGAPGSSGQMGSMGGLGSLLGPLLGGRTTP